MLNFFSKKYFYVEINIWILSIWINLLFYYINRCNILFWRLIYKLYKTNNLITVIQCILINLISISTIIWIIIYRERYNFIRNLITLYVDRQSWSLPNRDILTMKGIVANFFTTYFARNNHNKFTGDCSSFEIAFCAHLSNIISHCYHIRDNIIRKTVKFELRYATWALHATVSLFHRTITVTHSPLFIFGC